MEKAGIDVIQYSGEMAATWRGDRKVKHTRKKRLKVIPFLTFV